MTFTYTVTALDWARIAPELVLAGITLLLMMVDLFLPQTGSGPNDRHSGTSNFTALPALSVIGILGAFVATIILFVAGPIASNGLNLNVSVPRYAFNNMISADWSSLYGYLIVLSASLLGVLFSPAYLKRLNLVHQGEYYALLMLATTGMMLLTAAASLLTVFIGIEMLSLALYILCGFVARRKSSQESGMKYFLLSSFASAFLLYGIALTYGATGNTSFAGISQFLATHTARVSPSGGAYLAFPTHAMLLIGMGLLAVGFAFKVSAIPFQAWTPDVYEGAPAPVTAFMSIATKAAAILAFAHVFGVVLYAARTDWLPIIETITILTIIGGNVLALVQNNLKRLLAYSGIAHAGYLLIGIVAASAAVSVNGAQPDARVTALSSILFYLLCYTFLNMGAFGIASLLERTDNSGNDMQDLRGLWYRHPVMAGLLAFFLLALAGFPPMAGFAGKYYIFYAALNSGHPELLIIGVLASILGMYYYLRIIAAMFMEGDSAITQVLGLGNAPTTTVSPTVPTTPRVSATPRIVPAKAGTTGSTGRLATSSSATAVVVKTPTADLAKASSPVMNASTEQETTNSLSWITWTGIGIAAIGTLAMGTVLPFWLIGLAQQAANMMIR
ncbi:MAG: NADH-quinone oxidoreductase subunit N [Ktedonobacteraceae bacterium]